MNQVELIGRLCRDIELKTTDHGKCYLRNTVASNRRTGKQKQQADFISIVAFNKTAEHVQCYLTKGDELAVVGHLSSSQYTAKDGNTVYSIEVIVDRVTFLRKKNTNVMDEIPNVHVTLN